MGKRDLAHFTTRIAAAGLLFVPCSEASDQPIQIDLPTTLRLAGAQNADVQIARERVEEARALHTSAVWSFFPWLAIGVGYRGHEGRIQDVAGNLIDASKYSYGPGVTMAAQLELGDAVYRSFARRQIVEAAEYSLAGQKQRATLTAAEGYFDLTVAQAAVGVAQDSLGIARAYEREVHEAVAIGIALRADELRVKVQAERNALAARQAVERRRAAAAGLAQTLHLDPTTDLLAQDADPLPVTIIDPESRLDVLVQEALRSHPAIRESQALVEAAESDRRQATYGPLVPSLTGLASWGWLGGGRNGVAGTGGESLDYAAMIQWRLGPGGLLDQGRIGAARARRAGAERTTEKVRDEIVRKVVESRTRLRSQADQLKTAKEALAVAEEALTLTRQRREFAVANILENIVAEQDLTRARNDYLHAVGEYDKSQFALKWAMGGLTPEAKPTR